MRFTGGCIGKIISFVLTLILGAVLGLGGAALGVYLFVDKDGGMGTAGDYLSTYVPDMSFDDEIKKLSVLDWLGELASLLVSTEGAKIGDLERYLGMGLISNAFYHMTGIHEDIIKASTVADIGATISENLTMTNAKEKFGIEFPDMPVFENEEFLSKTLATAFSKFDQFTLSEVIKIEDGATAVLKALADVKISELGGAEADTVVKSMFLCELMTIDDSSTKTLQALQYACIESQYEKDESGAFVLDGVTGEKIYKTKDITVLNGTVEETLTLPLIGLNEKIEELGIADVVDVTDDSHAVMRKMRDDGLKLNELGGDKLISLINGMRIDEFVKIDQDSEIILQSLQLRGTTIASLNTDMGDLSVLEIFGAEKCQTGAISLIPKDTKLDDIPTAMNVSVKNASIYQLEKRGVIDTPNYDTLSLDQIAFISNQTIFGLLDSYIATIRLINGVNPQINELLGAISTEKVTAFSNHNYTISEFVAKYNMYDTIVVPENMRVTAVAGTDDAFFNAETGRYEVPLFNARSAGGYAIEFDGNGFEIEIMVVDYITDGYVGCAEYGYAYWENASLSGDYYYDTVYINPVTL